MTVILLQMYSRSQENSLSSPLAGKLIQNMRSRNSGGSSMIQFSRHQIVSLSDWGRWTGHLQVPEKCFYHCYLRPFQVKQAIVSWGQFETFWQFSPWFYRGEINIFFLFSPSIFFNILIFLVTSRSSVHNKTQSVFIGGFLNWNNWRC